MQEFTIFDMVILGITLVLGLKGLFRGLIKEVFGIVGIIGAIFVASRVSKEVGDLIAPFLALDNQTTIKLIGFIIALIGFWLIVYVLGMILSKLFNLSGLGLFDRIFGFVFGAAKVFLIFSVIAYSMYQIESFKKAIDTKTEGSLVMPHLISVGSYIIKLDTSAIRNTIEKTVDDVVKTEETKENDIVTKKENISETVTKTVNEIKDSVVKEVEQTIQNKIKDMTTTTEEKK